MSAPDGCLPFISAPASCEQNVTLGGTGKEVGDRHPKISDNVLIGASATVLGNIVVGRGAQVGKRFRRMKSGGALMAAGPRLLELSLSAHNLFAASDTLNVFSGAQIAAGSLVLKPVPPHTMVAGSPAKPVGKLFGEWRGRCIVRTV